MRGQITVMAGQISVMAKDKWPCMYVTLSKHTWMLDVLMTETPLVMIAVRHAARVTLIVVCPASL